MMAEAPRRQPSVYSIAWAFYLLIAVVGLIWLGFQNGRLHLGIFLDPATWPVDLALGLAAGGAVAGVWTLGVRRWTPLRELESELGRVLGPLRREEALALALISGLAE